MAVTGPMALWDEPLWLDGSSCLALQREYNALASRVLDNVARLIVRRDNLMTRLNDYSTAELERLTTLTEATAKPGEFVRRDTMTTYRVDDGAVDSRGRLSACLSGKSYERRVVSFADVTELDPPQADMLAELARRKAPPLRFRKGDVVVVTARTRNYAAEGHLATVHSDVLMSHTGISLTWDLRVPLLRSVDGEATWNVECFRLATPADIAAYEARIPKAPVFKVGELVYYTDTSSICGIVKGLPDGIGSWGDYYRITYQPEGCDGMEHPREFRPATDAEVAAYHRAHCQPKTEPVAPAPISNATHAGKKVRWFSGYIDYIVADTRHGRIALAPGVAVVLIAPISGAIFYCYNATELTEVAK